MFAKSYKYYLRLLEKKPKLSILQKILFLLFGLIVIIGGGSSTLFYWQYQKEASNSAAGFYVLLDNVDRTIASIESAQKNIVFQKEQLTKIPTPSVFNELRNQLLTYYDESLNLFDNLLKKHRFAKDFL